MVLQLLNTEKPKPRKYATKNEAIKKISNEINKNWAKKNLKKFLDVSNIRYKHNS